MRREFGLGVAAGLAGAVVGVAVPVAGLVVVDAGLPDIAPPFVAAPVADEALPVDGAVPVPAGAGPEVVGKVVIGVGASGTGFVMAEATKVSNSPAAASFLFRSL